MAHGVGGRPELPFPKLLAGGRLVAKYMQPILLESRTGRHINFAAGYHRARNASAGKIGLPTHVLGLAPANRQTDFIRDG